MSARRPQARWGLDDDFAAADRVARLRGEMSPGRRRPGGVRKALVALVALAASLGSCSATAAPRPDCEACAWALDVCVGQAKAQARAELAERQLDAILRYRAARKACARSYEACAINCEPGLRVACGRRAR